MLIFSVGGYPRFSLKKSTMLHMAGYNRRNEFNNIISLLSSNAKKVSLFTFQSWFISLRVRIYKSSNVDITMTCKLVLAVGLNFFQLRVHT